MCIRFRQEAYNYVSSNYKSLVEVRIRGAPGLVDTVFAIQAGSRGFDSHRDRCPNDFPAPTDDFSTQCALSELENVVSKWRSLISCSIPERGRWSPPYHVHAKYNTH